MRTVKFWLHTTEGKYGDVLIRITRDTYNDGGGLVSRIETKQIDIPGLVTYHDDWSITDETVVYPTTWWERHFHKLTFEQKVRNRIKLVQSLCDMHAKRLNEAAAIAYKMEEERCQTLD